MCFAAVCLSPLDIANKNKECLSFCGRITIFLPQVSDSAIYTGLNYVTEKQVLMILWVVNEKNKSADGR